MQGLETNEVASSPERVAPLDLRTVPSSELAREMARRNPSNYVRRVMRPCVWCGLPFGVRDMRNHLPECIHNQRRRAKKGNTNGN